MKISRGTRRRYDQADAAATKGVNGPRKAKERSRRDARILAKVKSGSLPYTPEVMSWLSVEIGKPASKVTSDDIRKLIS